MKTQQRCARASQLHSKSLFTRCTSHRDFLPLHETFCCGKHSPITYMMQLSYFITFQPLWHLKRLIWLISGAWFWVTSHRQDKLVPPVAEGEWNVVFQKKKIHPKKEQYCIKKKKKNFGWPFPVQLALLFSLRGPYPPKYPPLTNCLNLLSK